MNQPQKAAHAIVEPKISRVLPTAELRSRKVRKNILKPTPLTPKPVKTIV